MVMHSPCCVLPHLHVALALLAAQEEHKLVEAPELIWAHCLIGVFWGGGWQRRELGSVSESLGLLSKAKLLT